MSFATQQLYKGLIDTLEQKRLNMEKSDQDLNRMRANYDVFVAHI